MKKAIKYIIYAVVAMALTASCIITALTTKHNKTLIKCNAEQSKVIDSLLNRRMKVVDVKLYVTDKSKNVVYGRYNKGTISMPQERKYILEVDSVSIK